jgi:tungstate transport system ATP-binding protein
MDAYRLRNVRFAYGSTVALDIDALDFPAGAVTALVGPNGSGKTTLLNILGFLCAPASGTLEFMGQPVPETGMAALRRRIGYVQQKPYLFNGSVRWNLEVPLRWRGVPAAERRRRAAEMLARFGIAEFAERRVRELSGGEAQKVALARALVTGPEVLLLDEPFSFLDRHFSERIEQWLRDAAHREPPTVVFTTHDLALAERCADTIRTLGAGSVIPFPPVNLYDGNADGDVFDTGRIRIRIAAATRPVRRIAIDSTQIVLSRAKLDSSMRNAFAGTIRAVTGNDGQLHVTVEAGETFTATITPAAWEELGLRVGDTAWVSFKSTAVHLL